MTRAIPLLAGLIAALVAFVSSGAQASPPAQTLGFTLHRHSAATERLPRYHASAPISVHVGGKASRLPATLLVTAQSPDGTAVTTSLVRTGDAFDGTLNLTTPGTWTVALTSKLGSVTNSLANVPVDVVTVDNADLAARLTYALSALSIAAGLALLLRTGVRPLALAFTKRS